MEDRWQPERTNGSSEGFVFCVEGRKSRGGITAGYKTGVINTCSKSSSAFSPASRDPPGHRGGGRSVGVFFCGDESIPASLRVSPDKAGSRVISRPAAPPLSPLSFLPFQPPFPVVQVSKTMCQEISDLREGQLLALCRQPGVGAVIYLLFGAASVEVSMENTPWRAICQHRRARVGEERGGWERGI